MLLPLVHALAVFLQHRPLSPPPVWETVAGGGPAPQYLPPCLYLAVGRLFTTRCWRSLRMMAQGRSFALSMTIR